MAVIRAPKILFFGQIFFISFATSIGKSDNFFILNHIHLFFYLRLEIKIDVVNIHEPYEPLDNQSLFFLLFALYL